MKKGKKILSFLFLTLLITISTNNITFAKTIVSMGVTPSRIYDELIGIGDSKSFEFSIANTIEGTSEDLNINVNIIGRIEDEYGDIVNNSNIITFDKNQLTIKANSVEKIKANINIPKDMISGNYRFYIDIEQKSVDGFSLGEQTNTLTVPMYVFVGSLEDYNNQIIGYKILDSYIGSNGKNTTIVKESLNGMKKLINPLNSIEVFKEVINEPLYNFKTKEGNVLDFNNSYYTVMKDCSTTSDKLSNTKYIKYKKEDLNQKVSKAIRDANVMNIVLENNNVVKIELKNDLMDKLEEQLATISKSANEKATLDMLMNTLIVPKNKDYNVPKTYVINKIENYGNIPIVIKGKFDVFLNNFDKVAEGEINSNTILQKEINETKSQIKKGEFGKGTYNVSGIVVGKKMTENITNSFKVENQRYLILIILGIFMIFYYLCILFGIKYIYKKMKNNKNKKINNKNNNSISA